MRSNRQKNKAGQGVLEMTIVIVLMTLLLGGILNIWLWANNQIVRRQKEYNASRVVAGTSKDGYVLEWPVYQPEELREDRALLTHPKLGKR
jgi:hypothetical protein